MEKCNTVFIGMGGGFGPLAQAMPIADELTKNGMEIICQTHRAAMDMVKRMGLKVLDLPQIEPPKIINPNGPEWWNEDYLWSKYGFLDYDYVKALIEYYTEEIKKINPKLIISVHTPTAAVVARRLKIPLVCVVQACMLEGGKGGRTTWWKELPRNLDRTSIVINKVLEEMGMGLLGKMEELNEGLLTIVPSIPEFDVISGGNVFYTGPMYWQGPEELLEGEYDCQRHNKHLVHVYTGHLINSKGIETGLILLNNIVKAFNNTEFDVIISTGTGQSVPKALKTADNITISEWVPVNKLIPQCDLIIHHGGHGSSLQGIAHGVPALVTPTTDEREYNARQLYELGVGLYITPAELTPELILYKAREIVNSRKMTANSKKLAEVVRRRNYNGASEAARMILELIKK